MADEFGGSVTAGGEDRFDDLDLEGMAYVIFADFEQVPKWRTQAKGYRRLAVLAEQLRGDLSVHVNQAMDSWSSKGALGVHEEATKIDDSFRRGLESARGNAEALERIADEVEDARAEISRLQTEWAEMKAKYQKNPHLFDGYSADGMSGYQAAKASYDRSARERMHAMSVVASQAWYTNMHKPGEYTGPRAGREPKYPLHPSTGSGSGGGPDTTYPFTYHPPPPSGMTPGTGPTGEDIAPPSGATPPRPPANDPSLEFPTAPVHSPGPAVISPTVPSPTGPAPLPSGGFPSSAPPVSPGLFNGLRQASSGALPGQPARTSPSVLGQRAGTASGRPAAVARPGAASPERGVIRNPKQANGSGSTPQQRSSRREQDREDDVFRDGPETDELFEGLSLDSVPDVVRPEAPPPRMRRRDVGPVLRQRLR
ncbi:WXG100 family type VII secretion target [Phytomonospora endophytica]|uniref:Uncharacterized protein n=1 Tax=Phytomonospora endophytica TaxID=714109 RepID=A0A841FU16_9ACTN|nr:hypothetical protein [Phytomonospora endophytica]MBB6038273.1 hypothetical protein [Phytomonospora endophytica]GIG64202.1 hypothetical protein Pen01_04970 [Phytomonospora endophytica]